MVQSTVVAEVELLIIEVFLYILILDATPTVILSLIDP
jgi:hypothetical protein